MSSLLPLFSQGNRPPTFLNLLASEGIALQKVEPGTLKDILPRQTVLSECWCIRIRANLWKQAEHLCCSSPTRYLVRPDINIESILVRESQWNINLMLGDKTKEKLAEAAKPPKTEFVSPVRSTLGEHGGACCVKQRPRTVSFTRTLLISKQSTQGSGVKDKDLICC